MASVATAFQSGGWGFEIALQARTARGSHVEARLRGLRVEPAVPGIGKTEPPRVESQAKAALLAPPKRYSERLRGIREADETPLVFVPVHWNNSIYNRRGRAEPLRFMREPHRVGGLVDTYA